MRRRRRRGGKEGQGTLGIKRAKKGGEMDDDDNGKE